MAEKLIRVHVLATAVEEFGDDGLTVIDPIATYKMTMDNLQEFHHFLVENAEVKEVLAEAKAKLAPLLVRWGDARLAKKRAGD